MRPENFVEDIPKAIQMFPSKEGWIGLYPETQHSLVDICNPYITNIEGFYPRFKRQSGEYVFSKKSENVEKEH